MNTCVVCYDECNTPIPCSKNEHPTGFIHEACLSRWFEAGHVDCPLCRSLLALFSVRLPLVAAIRCEIRNSRWVYMATGGRHPLALLNKEGVEFIEQQQKYTVRSSWTGTEHVYPDVLKVTYDCTRFSAKPRSFRVYLQNGRILANKAPYLTDQGYMLEMRGLVTQPSVKNFILEDDSLLFGKIGNRQYIMEILPPLTLLEGLCIVQTCLAWKLSST